MPDVQRRFADARDEILKPTGWEPMAYMRGEYYVWRDESVVNIWAADGLDAWDVSGWHLDAEDRVQATHLKDGEDCASGIGIPQDIMDEYVVMRLAEMMEDGSVDQTVDRAVNKWERESLQRNASTIKVALQIRRAE